MFVFPSPTSFQTVLSDIKGIQTLSISLWNLKPSASAFIDSRPLVSLSNTKEYERCSLHSNMKEYSWDKHICRKLHCGFLLLGGVDDGKKEETKWQQEVDPMVRLGWKFSHRPTYSVTIKMRFLSRSPQRWACFQFLHIHSLKKGHFSLYQNFV